MKAQKYTPNEINQATYEIHCIGQNIGQRFEYEDLGTLDQPAKIDYLESVYSTAHIGSAQLEAYSDIKPICKALEGVVRVNNTLRSELRQQWDTDHQRSQYHIIDCFSPRSKRIIEIESEFMRSVSGPLKTIKAIKGAETICKEESIPGIIEASHTALLESVATEIQYQSEQSSLVDKSEERMKQARALTPPFMCPSPWKADVKTEDIRDILRERAKRYSTHFDTPRIRLLLRSAITIGVSTSIGAAAGGAIGGGIGFLIGGPPGTVLGAKIGGGVGATLGLGGGVILSYDMVITRLEEGYKKVIYQGILPAFKEVTLSAFGKIALHMENKLRDATAPITLDQNPDYASAKAWLSAEANGKLAHLSAVVDSALAHQRIDLCNTLITQGGKTPVTASTNTDNLDLNSFFKAVETEITHNPNENEKEIREQIAKYREFNLRQEANRTATHARVEPGVNQIKRALEKLITEIPVEIEWKEQGGTPNSGAYDPGTEEVAEEATAPSGQSKPSDKSDSPFQGWIPTPIFGIGNGAYPLFPVLNIIPSTP